MTKPRKSKTNIIENQLANYTDRILADKNSIKQDGTIFAPDEEELQALKQIALRLRDFSDGDDPDEIAIRRMRNNITEAWQQKESKANKPFWQKWIMALRPSEQKWQSQHSRKRAKLRLSLAMMIVLMLISIPFFNLNGINQPGASGQYLNSIGLLSVFGGLILLAFWWFFRRKP